MIEKWRKNELTRKTPQGVPQEGRIVNKLQRRIIEQFGENGVLDNLFFQIGSNYAEIVEFDSGQ